MTPREIVSEYGPGEVADTIMLNAIIAYGDQRAADAILAAKLVTEPTPTPAAPGPESS